MKTTTLFLALVVSVLPAFSQSCPDCEIDESYTTPGLYPVIIPPATAGEYYETDLTFVLQEDTTVEVLGDMVTFAFLNYNILEPIGLPYGINVSSNLGDFPVNYDPDVSLYGCAKVCGTPLIAGTYTITVPLIATLEDPAGDQPAEYEIILEVLPASGSSGGIVTTATFGCSPLTIDLSSGHPSDGADGFSYTWDFGDGSSGTMENPGAMTFTADGTEPVEYIITHTVAVDTIGYSLDYVVVTATNCDDCAFFGCTGLFLEENPDLYLSIPDLGITTDYYLDTNPPLTFSLNSSLDPLATYTMQVKDDDDGGFGADDNCGSITFNGDDVGVFSYDIGSSNVDISISHPVITYTYTDTIIVYPVPAIPLLSVSGESVICEEDSVVLSTIATPDVTYQWYNGSDPIPAAFDATYVAYSSGTYTVVATAEGGCTATSDSFTTEVLEYPIPPFVSVSDNTLNTTSDYPLQWYYNGDPIPGATGESYTPAIEGIYQVSAANGPCLTFSGEIDFIFQSVSTNNPFFIQISPNPFNEIIHINGNFIEQGTATWVLQDLQGRILLEESNQYTAGAFSHTLDCSEVPAGIYILSLQHNSSSGSYQIMKY